MWNYRISFFLPHENHIICFLPSDPLASLVERCYTSTINPIPQKRKNIMTLIVVKRKPGSQGRRKLFKVQDVATNRTFPVQAVTTEEAVERVKALHTTEEVIMADKVDLSYSESYNLGRVTGYANAVADEKNHTFPAPDADTPPAGALSGQYKLGYKVGYKQGYEAPYKKKK